MKKLFLAFLLLSGFHLGAQVFENGDFVIQPAAGLGIFRYQFTDITNNVVGERDTSAAWCFPLQVEYGINKWSGGSLNFTYHNFPSNNDSANYSTKASVIDVGLAGNLHLTPMLEKFDFVLSAGYGYSNFKYTTTQVNSPVAKSNGSVFFVGINPRLYFTEDARFGITGWYRYSKHNFAKGKVTDNAGLTYDFKLEGPGNSFGLGLVFKI